MNTERFAHLPLTLARPSGHEIMSPPREFEGLAFELDQADEEIIMQQDTQYPLLIESTKKFTENITEFAQNHRIAFTVGVTATLIAANIVFDHLTRPKTPNPNQSSV